MNRRELLLSTPALLIAENKQEKKSQIIRFFYKESFYETIIVIPDELSRLSEKVKYPVMVITCADYKIVQEFLKTKLEFEHLVETGLYWKTNNSSTYLFEIKNKYPERCQNRLSNALYLFENKFVELV